MKTHLKPPAWVDSLIDMLAPEEFSEEIRGDLFELFRIDLKENGISSARRKYVFNGLGFLVKNFFWKRQSSYNANPIIMLTSYFKMAGRNLSAYKGNTIINILGLIIGITSALVILTVIRFELSFDTFHSNTQQIYRMVRVSSNDLEASKRTDCRTGISYPVPDAVRSEVSAIENITSMEYFGGALIEVPDKAGTVIRRFREESGCVMVEPSFFEIFDFKGTGFKWIAGNPEKALTEPFSVVLTQSLAMKYFPDGNALGMTLRFEKQADCKVTGVVEDLPHNTDFPFTVFVSYASLDVMNSDRMNDWSSVNDDHHTYVVLTPGSAREEVEKQIAKVHAAHTPKDLHESRYYLLQALRELHFDPRFENFSKRTISRETILAIGLVGLFLLLTAAINYINLSTAQSVMRSKEIGLRKVMGSNRKNLITLLMTETFVVVLVAGVIGLILSETFLSNFQSFLNIKLTGYNLTDPFILLSLSLIILIVTLLAGLYPSVAISRFNPAATLRSKFTTERIGGFSLRKVLVVAQFAITQMLVVGTFMVVAQMKYFRNVDMGFDREAIINLKLPGRTNPQHLQTMEEQFRSQAFVSEVSFSSTLPSGLTRNRSAMDIGRADATTSKDYVIFEWQSVDPSYLHLFNIKLLAGRNFHPGDSSENILINKTLARNLRLGSPEEAINKELKMGPVKKTVTGVIDDYYTNSLKEDVGNIVWVTEPRAFDYVSLKLNMREPTETLPEVIKQIEKIWTATYPEHIFSYDFFDDNIKAFYVQEEKYAKLFQLFSLIFLLIGCLGLYGLITFVVNRKGKEVALRKVLGATIPNILLMFSREYVQLIVLSFLIAAPVSYYVVNQWLSNFKNHIELHWSLFAIPGLLVLSIALLVIITKSMRTASANPVDHLKYE